MLEIRDVRIVVQIAESGGVGTAAKRLGLTQPALTRRLKNIEAQLGSKLFARHTRGVTLTQSGEQFVEEAKSLLVHSADFQKSMEHYGRGENGDLSIGIKPGLDEAFFGDSILQFSLQYPRVFLNIKINSTPALTRLVRSGELNLAIGARGYAADHDNEAVIAFGLKFEPLFSIPLQVVVRKNHPILKNNVIDGNLLNYPLVGPTPTKEIVQNLHVEAAKIGKTFDGFRIRVDDYQLIMRMIQNTDMWTAIFEPSRTKVETTGKYTIIESPGFIPPMEIGLVTRTTWSMSPAAENMIRIIKENAKQWLT